MKKRLSLVLLNILLCLSAIAFLCGYTATAKADGTKYTVRFYLDAGNTVEYTEARQEVDAGDCAEIPVTPTKGGDYFLFWKLGEEKFSFKTPITADINLTAEWLTPDPSITVTEMYSVKFVVGGEVVNEQSVEKGKDATAPTGFDLPDGKLFLNWDKEFINVQNDITVNANLTDAEYSVKVIGFDDEKITVISGVSYGDPVNTDSIVIPPVSNYHVDENNKFIGNTYCITEDGEIYINYIPNVYTATFKVGTEVYGTVQNVNYGEYVECPAIPEKQGYIFKGWYTEGEEDTAFDFNALIEQDITVFAKYQAIENKKYDVTFYNYDGIQYGAVQRVEEGKTAIPAGRPAREGYEFRGWFISGETKTPFDFSTPITADISLNAMFKIKDYTVTVMSDGEVVSVQTVKYGKNATEPQIEVKEGYIFTGFDASFKDIRKDTTINATFRLKTFAVMFIDSYGKKMCPTQYVEYGKSATAPQIPVMEGYTSIGWSEDYENVTDDIVVVPLYEKITFQVEYYDGNTLYETKTVEYGRLAINVIPEKEDYIFAGWFTDSSFNTAYDFNNEVKSNLVLYGKWDVKPVENYTVTFKVDGAIYAMYSVEHGHNCPSPVIPNKYGYTFTGWDGEYFNVTEDLVINATFTEQNFNVYFRGYQGAGSDDIKVKYGSFITKDLLPVDVPEKEGYTFTGFDYDETKPVTEDITIYANYDINVYEVTFEVEGEVYSIQYVKHNKYANVPNQPSIYGKQFKGWYIKNTDTPFNFREGVTADVIIEAKVSAELRKIFYYLDNKYYDEQEFEVGAVIIDIGDPDISVHTEFYGWQGFPDDMIMPNRNVSIYGYTLTHYEYSITYYINGRVYAEDKYYDGDAVTMRTAPSDNDLAELSDVDTVFIGWDSTITTMPTGDVEIVANLKKYYYITYSINDYYHEVFRILEGESITPMGAPKLPDGVVFVRWENEPAVMLNYNTVVEGTIMKNYTISYYVDGELYREVEVFQGEKVTPIDLPAEQYNDFIVDAWGEIPETMPTYDVRVDAVIRRYYEVYYYLDGELYRTVKLPEGEVVPTMGTPETDENTLFIEWDKVVDTMPVGGATVSAIVKHYYMLWYNVDNVTYREFKILEGDTITPISYENDIEGIVFNGWNNFPEDGIMPAKSVFITASITKLNQYTLFYMVGNGVQFKSVAVYETYQVTPLTETFDPAKYGIEGVFVGWIGEPKVMPSENVYITADIRICRTLSYYLNDILYDYCKVVAGSAITPIGAPDEDRLDPNQKFERWGNFPADGIMPDEDLRIDAILTTLNAYTITYYIEVEDEPCYSQNCYETKPVTPMKAPNREIPGKEFVRWVGEPSIMPSENVTVYAEYRDKTKYTITYYLDGEYYASNEYYAGERIRNMDNPVIIIPDAEFSGWKGEPEDGLMPDHNVDVYGYIYVGAHDNEFFLELIDSDEESVTLALKVRGNVELGGFIGELEFNYNMFNRLNTDYDSDYMTFGRVDNKYCFIWTYYENVTEETTFITITLNRAQIGEGNWEDNVFFNINEARAFINDGEEVEPRPYTVTR